MGLWIRSQDKEKLINSQVIGLSNGDTEIWDFEFSLKLGTYSTKEKALKVLDGIQKHICRKDHLQQEYSVIQIPLDNEVE